MNGERRTSPTFIFLVPAALIAALPVVLALYYHLHPGLGYLAGINLSTFVLYGYDKAVAGGERLRVPESVLHFLAFLGGSPAALLSQKLFRHKTVKTSFRRVYWLIVVLQAALVGAGLWFWQHPPSWLPGRN